MRNVTSLLGLLVLALPFMGVECTEERITDTVLTTTISTNWNTEGFTQGTDSDSRVVSVSGDIKQALDDLDAEELESLSVSGVLYEILENRGSAARIAAQHNGTVKVEDQTVLTFTSPNTAPGTTGNPTNGRVVMQSAGTTFLNDRFAQYLASYKSGSPNGALLDNITFHASWESVPNASQTDQDDFDWRVGVVLQIVAKVKLDVFAP